MKYKPFSQGYFKYEMGLKALDLSQWIEIDEHWNEQLALKGELLKQQRDKVLNFTSSAEVASRELMEILAEHLVQHFPDKFSLKKNLFTIHRPADSHLIHAEFPEADQVYDLNDLPDHPLAVMARWVQEDFCLMNPANGEARLEGGCVCFPSRWKLIEKVGHNMAGIHQPVPDFNKNLEKPSTRFMLNTTADKPMWRMNWTIHASSDLFAYGPAEHVEPITSENVLAKSFLRTERQTLRKLPRTGFVAFSIRTYMTPVKDIAANPEDRQSLLKTLTTMPEEVLKYRGMAGLVDSLKKALA